MTFMLQGEGVEPTDEVSGELYGPGQLEHALPHTHQKNRCNMVQT